MNTRHLTTLAAAGLLAVASLSACGSDDDVTPGTGVDTNVTDTTTVTSLTTDSSVPSTTGG